MNTLSWLIYFAGLSSSARGFFGFLAGAGGLVAVLGFILSILWTGASYSSQRDIEAYQSLNKRGKSMLPIGMAMLIGFGSLSAFLPSANTVYAIAASEAGERVVASESVRGLTGDATKALQAWLKKQIEPEDKR